jgi:hypothetical protein
MKLITANQNNCVAASLAMLLGHEIEYIEIQLFTGLTKPFPGQWSDLPKVPDMNVICSWMWRTHQIALTPFEYSPLCAPHKDCPAVPVYPTTTSYDPSLASAAPDIAFNAQMAYGPGLIEGNIVGQEVGHMCAWDGKVIYDPHGYGYPHNVAQEKFGYQVTRFWLAVKGKTL